MLTIDSSKYRALLLDFDGTLVHTEPAHYEAFRKTLQSYGKDFVSYEDHNKHYTGTGTRHILRTEFQRHNVDTDLEKAVEQKKNAYADLIASKGAPITPGVKEFLLAAKEKGMKLALVSGGMRENIDLVIEHTGIPKVFDVEITGEDVSKPKPDPEGFTKALEFLHVDPQASIVFEDGINGIKAAVAAGITRQFALSQHIIKEQAEKILPEITFISDFTEITFL